MDVQVCTEFWQYCQCCPKHIVGRRAARGMGIHAVPNRTERQTDKVSQCHQAFSVLSATICAGPRQAATCDIANQAERPTPVMVPVLSLEVCCQRRGLHHSGPLLSSPTSGLHLKRDGLRTQRERLHSTACTISAYWATTSSRRHILGSRCKCARVAYINACQQKHAQLRTTVDIVALRTTVVGYKQLHVTTSWVRPARTLCWGVYAHNSVLTMPHSFHYLIPVGLWRLGALLNLIGQFNTAVSSAPAKCTFFTYSNWPAHTADPPINPQRRLLLMHIQTHSMLDPRLRQTLRHTKYTDYIAFQLGSYQHRPNLCRKNPTV